MNRFQTTFRSIAAAGFAALVLAAAPAAHAGGGATVSIGLPLPPLPPLPGLPSLRIEGPRIVLPAPVVVAPEPRVVVAPAPRVVYTEPVVVGRGWHPVREVRYVREERCEEDRGREGWRRGEWREDRRDDRRHGGWDRDGRRHHHGDDRDHGRDERRGWR